MIPLLSLKSDEKYTLNTSTLRTFSAWDRGSAWVAWLRLQFRGTLEDWSTMVSSAHPACQSSPWSPEGTDVHEFQTQTTWLRLSWELIQLSILGHLRTPQSSLYYLQSPWYTFQTTPKPWQLLNSLLTFVELVILQARGIPTREGTGNSCNWLISGSLLSNQRQPVDYPFPVFWGVCRSDV